MNKLSDAFSNMVDYEDYSVSKLFFIKAQNITGFNCDFDRFANNFNAQLPRFNSTSYCVGTSGVDAFNYNWEASINWLFPAPRLIIRTVNHLKNCKAKGVLITPLWRSSTFFPYLLSPIVQPGVKGSWTFPGQNIFVQGSDKASYFGPNFNAGVVIWKLDFS